jgi:hypothetical protein
MRSLIRPVLVALLFFPAIANAAEVIIYRTYADFSNKTGEKIEGFKYHNNKGTSDATLIFVSEANKKEQRVFACADIWGLSYDSVLYRTVKAGAFLDKPNFVNTLARVTMTGNIIFYENGINHLYGQARGYRSIELPPSATGYMSATLESDMVLLSDMDPPDWVVDAGLAFFKQNPAYAPIETCLYRGEKKIYFRFFKARACGAEFLGVAVPR